MKRLSTVLAASALALAAGSAGAATYNNPVAANAYITYGGLQWAWASAAEIGSFAIDLTYQAAYGWRLPTATELLSAPVAQDFLFAGGNVPFGGTDPLSGSYFSYLDASYTDNGACAAAYFSNSTNCDWGNAPGTMNDPQPWQGQPGAPSYAEGLVVRGIGAAIPVPAAGVMLLSGLGLFGGLTARRRRKDAAA